MYLQGAKNYFMYYEGLTHGSAINLNIFYAFCAGVQLKVSDTSHMLTSVKCLKQVYFIQFQSACNVVLCSNYAPNKHKRVY